MNSTLQTYLALTVVLGTVAALVWRWAARRKNPGCGSDCGCPSSEIKVAAAKVRRP